MHEPAAIFITSFVGLAAGGVMQSQLVHLRYRLPDGAELPKPRSGWVIPATAALTAVTWWVMQPGRPSIVPIV